MLKIKTARVLFFFTLIVSLATVGVVSFNTASDSKPAPVSRKVPIMEQTIELPRCSEATGRFDGTCWYQGKHTDRVINFNHGQWTYDMNTRDMIHNLYRK